MSQPKPTTSYATCDHERLEKFLQSDHYRIEDEEMIAHLDWCTTCREKLETQAGDAQSWKSAAALLKPSEFDFSSTAIFSAASGTNSNSLHAGAIQDVLKSLAPTDDPHRLGRIGNYEVVGVVGVGAMGVVLKAIDPSLDRVVAVKVMAPRLANNEMARKRFSREAKAAAAVLHPNVIPIHSVSSNSTLPYLVMTYVRGGSLQKRLDDEGHLPLVEVLRIGSQIAAGLSAAHEQGLVHRDIKPENILLDEGVERVSITDFGLARAVDDNTMTQQGTIAGTPMYMSPEQARGEQLDQQSDLFSLGSVLYALCTGKPPYKADSSYGVMRRIIDESPTPLRELNPEIPEWFARIVERLMAKEKSNRFATAIEVNKLLEACLSHVQQPNLIALPDIPGQVLPVKQKRFLKTRKGILTMMAKLLIYSSLLPFVLMVLNEFVPLGIFSSETDFFWYSCLTSVVLSTIGGVMIGVHQGISIIREGQHVKRMTTDQTALIVISLAISAFVILNHMSNSNMHIEVTPYSDRFTLGTHPLTIVNTSGEKPFGGTHRTHKDKAAGITTRSFESANGRYKITLVDKVLTVNGEKYTLANPSDAIRIEDDRVEITTVKEIPSKTELKITGPASQNAVVQKDHKTPEIFIESYQRDGTNTKGDKLTHRWNLKGESVGNMKIRVLHIENGKTRIVSESLYQGGKTGEQNIDIEFQLETLDQPLPTPGRVLVPELAVSVNGLKAISEARDEFILNGEGLSTADAHKGKLGFFQILTYTTSQPQPVDNVLNLDAILAASKKGASFIVTTLAWEPVCLDKSLEGKPVVIDENLDPAIRIMEEEYHKISKIMKNLDNYNYGMTAEEKESSLNFLNNSLKPTLDKLKKDAGIPLTKLDATNSDEKAIQGTWQVTYSEDSGRVAPQESLKDIKFIFEEGGLTMHMGAKKQEATYLLDASTSPKQIDWIENSKIKKGIYDLQGDTLRICLSEQSKERPTAFDSKANSANDILIQLKRQMPGHVGLPEESYSGDQLDVKKAVLNKDGKLEINYSTLIESMYYCPGANSKMTEQGLELVFVRSLYNKKEKVDHPNDSFKQFGGTITVAPQNKPVYVRSGDKLQKIWDPKGNQGDGKTSQNQQDPSVNVADSSTNAQWPEEDKNMTPPKDADKILEQQKPISKLSDLKDGDYFIQVTQLASNLAVDFPDDIVPDKAYGPADADFIKTIRLQIMEKGKQVRVIDHEHIFSKKVPVWTKTETADKWSYNNAEGEADNGMGKLALVQKNEGVIATFDSHGSGIPILWSARGPLLEVNEKNRPILEANAVKIYHLEDGNYEFKVKTIAENPGVKSLDSPIPNDDYKPVKQPTSFSLQFSNKTNSVSLIDNSTPAKLSGKGLAKKEQLWEHLAVYEISGEGFEAGELTIAKSGTELYAYYKISGPGTPVLASYSGTLVKVNKEEPKIPEQSSSKLEAPRVKPMDIQNVKHDQTIDVKALLEKGQSNAKMPEGLIVRIGACMGEADDNAPADAKVLIELWEFTPNEVHRVERDSKNGKTVYNRLESKKFDSQGLCKDLLDGRALEIQARKGTGPETVLAGTIYHRGSRSIDVEWNGQTIMDLSETNGPFLQAYRETDAKAFGELYQRLASQARALFDPKADKTSEKE